MANHSLFSLALVIYYFLCTTLHAESSTTSFVMTNGLPAESADVPLNLLVKSETKVIDNRLLKVGETFKWGVTQNSIYYVRAILGDKFASVHGFDPSRDAGFDKETVFWLVKEDGFYFSYDDTYWQKDAPWEWE